MPDTLWIGWCLRCGRNSFLYAQRQEHQVYRLWPCQTCKDVDPLIKYKAQVPTPQNTPTESAAI